MRERVREKAVWAFAQITAAALRLGEQLQQLRESPKKEEKNSTKKVERQIPSVWDELG